MNLSEVKLLEDFFGVPDQPERREIRQDPLLLGWQLAKRITLIILLAGAFMFYFLLDKLSQGMSAF